MIKEPLLNNPNFELFMNKTQKELVDGIFQELKFLGMVSMEANQKNPTYP